MAHVARTSRAAHLAHRIARLAAFGCAAFFLAHSCGHPSSASLDWPLFRGDSSLCGYAAVELPEQPKLLWTFTSNERTASSPVVYGQTVYWCSKRGKIFGIGAQGALRFEHDFATAVEATPAIRDSVLYIGRIDGCIYALALPSADTLWMFETMGQVVASANFASLNGAPVLACGSWDNFFYLLSLRDGREVKRYESGYYINGAAALCGSQLVFGGCDGWLRVIDTRSARATDSLNIGIYIPGSPAVRQGCAYVGDNSGNVYELVLNNGRIASHRTVLPAASNEASFVSVPAVGPEAIYIIGDDRYLYAIDRHSGSIRWRFLQKGDSGQSSPVACAGKVLACSRSGIVSLVNAADGALLWEYDTGEPITASPAVIAHRFYVLTARGTLFCFGENAK